MKHRIVPLLLSLSLLFGLCACKASVEEHTYSGKELLSSCKLQGRVQTAEDKITLNWSCDGIEFTAKCAGSVTMAVTPTALSSLDAAGGCYFTVVVDGKVMYEDLRIPENSASDVWTDNSSGYPYCIRSTETETFTLAENLSYGTHSFAVYKQTEAVDGAFTVDCITLSGSLCDAPKEKDTYIEFVGDSIVACMGNLTSGSGRTALYQDATRGWPYLTCKALDADWAMVCRSGITASDGFGWAGADSVSMQSVYPCLSYFSDTETAYDFARKPDAIVVSLGANDIFTYADCGKSSFDVSEGLYEMATLLREKNPDAKIVWIYGTTEPQLEAYVLDLSYAMGGEEKGFYTLGLPFNADGGHGHPALSVQSAYANILAEYLKGIL